jgi:hypothetical protein
MNEKNRNLAVGITVLVALAMLAGMIFIFAGLPQYFQRGYDLTILTDSTHNIKPGDSIYLAGMPVGHIYSVAFTDNDPRRGVTIVARVEHGTRIPANIVVYIFEGGSFQGAYVQLKTEGQYRIDAQTGVPMEFLPADRPTVLLAKVMPGGIVPAEVLDALKGLSKLADNLNNLIAPPPQAGAVQATSQAGSEPASANIAATSPADQAGLPGMVVKLNRTLDAMYAVLGSQENQANIKTSLANLSIASANAAEAMVSIKAFALTANSATTKASDDIHALAGKLIEDAERISQLVMTLNQAAMKINAGEGSFGKLLNDPALFNSLVEVSKGLKKMVDDFDVLAKKWNEQGVQMKIK